MLSYPPVNTQPANVTANGLPASTPVGVCGECGRPSVKPLCHKCRRQGHRVRQRLARAKQAAYLAALAAWEGEGGALPPLNPRLTLKQRGLKQCTACGAELPLGWFRRNGKGLRGRCRHCERPQKSRDAAIRRVRTKNQLGEVPHNTVEVLLAKQRGVCACGCRRGVKWHYHLDHIIPLSRGGTHDISNLQLLSPICNLRKGAKVYGR